MDDLGRMMELAQQGFYCGQILLIMALEAQGKSNPDLVRTMHGLSGGVGMAGETCGTLTGGACLLGLYAGKGTPEEEADFRLDLMFNELVEWFREEYGLLYGSIDCDNILANDPGNRLVRCPGIMAGTYQKVQELLAAYGFDLTSGRPS